jgi:hypothetical protein
METLAMFFARPWKWRDDNGVIHPSNLTRGIGWIQREKCTQPNESKNRKMKQ